MTKNHQIYEMVSYVTIKKQRNNDEQKANDNYFPGMWEDRSGLIIPSNEYIIRIHSIILVEKSDLQQEETEFPWRYFLCTNGVHASCSNNPQAPMGGWWMEPH
eukprot:228705_1